MPMKKEKFKGKIYFLFFNFFTPLSPFQKTVSQTSELINGS